MLEDFKKIIDEAIWAPSAENCQPWKFFISNTEIEVYNIQERDQQTWGQRASYFSHGTLLENIRVVSSKFGYLCNFLLFPDKNNPDLVAKVKLERRENLATNPLYKFIKVRTTNRKPYEKIPLDTKQTKELLNNISSEAKLYLLIDKDRIKRLSSAVSSFEQILFGNQNSHKFFFDHVTWNEEEDKKKSIGFFIKTLELPPPAKLLFPFIKNWKVMKLLKKINFHNLIAKENAKTYNSCGGMGAITIPDNTKENFIFAGILFQHTWLKATQLDLHMQPFGGVTFSMLEVAFGDENKFDPEEIKLLKKSYSEIKKEFDIKKEEMLTICFRIGKSHIPTAKSSRLPIIVKNAYV